MLRPKLMLRTLVASTALALLLAATASAGSRQESIFQDDRLLLSGSPEVQNEALDTLDSLGVDTIHSVVLFSRIEGSTVSQTTKPEGFDASNPAAYDAANWDAVDRLVRGAQARGIELLLSPASHGPPWASTCPRKFIRRAIDRVVCMQDPDEYGAFVEAMAKRYSGTYADENEGGGTLPKVERWSLSNEPNQGGWLLPQQRKRGGPPFSPVWYRRLAYAGIDALRQNGHSGSDIYLGETAPRGGSGSLYRAPTTPVSFYRKLFCITKKGRKLRGKKARRFKCNELERFDVEGIAHHPYTRGAFKPLLSKDSGGAITIRYYRRLNRLLSQAERRRLIPRRSPVYYTEFGVSSSPPAPRRLGVSLRKQATYINWFDYLAFRQSRVRGVAQFQLDDDSDIAAGNFQAGIRRSNGDEKPSFRAYRLPLYVVRKGRRLEIFGGVRGTGGETVEIRHRRKKGRPFRRIATARTNSAGWYVERIRRRKGQFRAFWESGDDTFKSRIAPVRKK